MKQFIATVNYHYNINLKEEIRAIQAEYENLNTQMIDFGDQKEYF